MPWLRSLVVAAAIAITGAGCGSTSIDATAAASGPSTPLVAPSPPASAPVQSAELAAPPRPTPTALTIVSAPPTTPASEVTWPEPTRVETSPSASASGSATVGPASASPPPPATPAEAAGSQDDGSQEVLAANGGETYTLQCARCHGQNGTGSDRYNGLIGVSNRYTSATMIAELTDGHAVTFGFRDTLSAGEIASVVAYVLITF